MTSIVRIGVGSRRRTRRLRQAVAKTAKGDTAKTAVAACRTAVVARYAVVARRTITDVTAARTTPLPFE